MRNTYFDVILLSICIVVVSCNSEKKADSEESNKTEVDLVLTKARDLFQPLPEIASNPENRATIEKELLGKTLFYDVRLSKNNTQSCNTCHNLATFGVDNKATSAGDLGKNGNRNSPTVYNAALHVAQFWDGRAKDVEEQAGMPIMNPVEMNMPSEKFVEDRLSKIEGYRKLFGEAFPEDKQPITYANMGKAIAVFERTLLTPTRFDKYLNGDVSSLTDIEKRGLDQFIETGCTTCHNGAIVGGRMFQKFPMYGESYMLATGSKLEDKGKMDVTKNENDKYIFKVPSLINITETGPYLHDGSVASLDSTIKIMAKLQLNKEVTKEQISDIKAFLASLKGEIPGGATIAPVMPN